MNPIRYSYGGTVAQASAPLSIGHAPQIHALGQTVVLAETQQRAVSAGFATNVSAADSIGTNVAVSSGLGANVSVSGTMTEGS